MRRVLAWLLLLSAAYAQQNGNAPAVRQSSGDLGVIPSPILSGSTYVGAYCWDWSAQPTAVTSCTDTNGVVPTVTLGTLAWINGCSGNPTFDPYCGFQMFWGKATSNGTPSISCTFPPNHQFLGSALELTGDLSADASNSGTATLGNAQISVTSTVQNDSLVSFLCQGNNAGVSHVVPATSMTFASDTNTGEINSPALWFNAGAAGTQTASWLGPVENLALGIAAFKPNALHVSTSALPVAGAGGLYKACVSGYGGSGAYTGSITVGSLPSGLSLTTDASCPGTNTFISGTPTTPGNSTFTVQLSDGTHTGTQALTLSVANTLATIQPPICSGFTTNPNSASIVGVKAGDPLFIFLGKGDDRHGTTGHLLVQPGAYTDSCGDSYYRWPTPMAGANAGGMQVMTTTATCSGTISPIYTSAGGSPLAGGFCDVPGGQQVMDAPVINQTSPGAVASPITLSSTYTPALNGIVFAMGSMDCDVGGGASCTMTATTSTAGWNLAMPSVTGFAGVPFTLYYQMATASTAYPVTFTYTDSSSANMAFDTPLLTEVFVRQGGPVQVALQGEKKRRHPE